jgi:cellulose synthase (UDP-forming)
MSNDKNLPVYLNTEKYNYVVKNTRWFKAFYILSLVLWYYIIFTIYSTNIHNIWVSLFFTPPIVILTVFYTLSKLINIFYPDKPFSIVNHIQQARNYWTNTQIKPSVDVFLPIAGEDTQVVLNTWRGVWNLRQKYGENLIVHVLDDLGDKSFELYASKFGFNYMSRPNKGEFKKAGNLNYALSKTSGEYVVIFDADFTPSGDFVDELLPYMSNKKVGIVQSPQFFDVNKQIAKRSLLEYGAGAIQEYFYKFVQPSLNKINSAICVGSNAIYRRSALESINGFALLNHSEDVWTGFKLVQKNWKINYIPVILAKGICPDDLQSFFNQQARWSGGSLSIISSGEFWKSKLPWSTRVGYASSFLFYFADLAALMLSFLIFAVLFTSGVVLTLQSLWMLGVFVVTSFFLVVVHQYPKARLGTLIAFNIACWAYVYSVLTFYIGKSENWQPTGVKKSLSNGFLNLVTLSTVYFISYVSLTIASITEDKVSTTNVLSLPVLFWIVTTVIVQSIYISYIWAYLVKKLVEAGQKSTGKIKLTNPMHNQNKAI